MTRGVLICIVEDAEGNRHYHRSVEFNGDMYIENGHGKEIIDKYESGDIKDLDGFYKYVEEFNKKNHNYEDDVLCYEVVLEQVNGTCQNKQCYKCEKYDNCNVSFDYENVSNLYDITSYSYHADYYYWLNLTDDDIEVLASNGVIKINSGGGAVFNFKRFIETELDSGFIDPEDSYDFEDEGYKGVLISRGLTEYEAQECVDIGIKEVNGVYDDVEEFGKGQLENYGVEDWLFDFIDCEKYGKYVLNYDGDGIHELNSGRVVIYG